METSMQLYWQVQVHGDQVPVPGNLYFLEVSHSSKYNPAVNQQIFCSICRFQNSILCFFPQIKFIPINQSLQHV